MALPHEALLASRRESTHLNVFHGGGFSEAIALRVRDAACENGVEVTMHNLVDFEAFSGGPAQSSPALLLITTIEDEQPCPASAACLRFLRRKSHGPKTLDGLQFAVLGLGDSNLLAVAWRRVDCFGARDCNQAAEKVDSWLKHLGGTRFCRRGEADDRTGNTEIDGWLERLWAALRLSGGAGV